MNDDEGFGGDEDWGEAPGLAPTLTHQSSLGPCDWCEGDGCEECGGTGRAKNAVNENEPAEELELCEYCGGAEDGCDECHGTGCKPMATTVTIPWRKQASQDLCELNQLKYIAKELPMSDMDNVQYRLLLPINCLNLGAEVFRAWSLKRDQYLSVDFFFGYNYWHNVDVMKKNKITLGMVKDIDETPSNWKLSWPVEDILARMFCSQQQTTAALNNINVEKRPYNPTEAKELSELTQVSFEVAVHALGVHGKMERARDALFDDSTKNKLVQAAATPDAFLFPATLSGTSSGTATSKEEDVWSWRKKAVKPEGPFEEMLTRYNAPLRVLKCLENFVKTINERCLICHRDLEFIGMKPSICKRKLCQMGNEGFGLAFDLAQELRDAPEVADLLITMAYCATIDNSGSCMSFVTPVSLDAPDANDITKFVDFRKPQEECNRVFAAEEQERAEQLKAGNTRRELVEGELETKYLDKNKLAEVFRLVPTVADMIKMADAIPLHPSSGEPIAEKPEKGQLEKTLRKIHPLLPGLVRWCFQSQLAHFRLLEPHERMESVTSAGARDCVQFAFIQSNPRTEARFTANKEKVEAMGRPGSVWSWHGSPVANWHPITRIGLKNLSNTKYMRVGAAYGAGIYTAVDSMTSAGSYCQPSAWSNSMWKGHIKLMALCEIVNWPIGGATTVSSVDRGTSSCKSSYEATPGCPAIRYIPANKWWLVEDEDSICTRFLFVLRNGALPTIQGDQIKDIPVLMSRDGLGKSKQQTHEDDSPKEDAGFPKDPKKKKGFSLFGSKK